MLQRINFERISFRGYRVRPFSGGVQSVCLASCRPFYGLNIAICDSEGLGRSNSCHGRGFLFSASTQVGLSDWQSPS